MKLPESEESADSPMISQESANSSGTCSIRDARKTLASCECSDNLWNTLQEKFFGYFSISNRTHFHKKKTYTCILRFIRSIVDVAQKVAQPKWHWAGHVCRIPDKLWAQVAQSWCPETVSRGHGGPRRRWRDDWIDSSKTEGMRHGIAKDGRNGGGPSTRSGAEQANK